MIRRQAISGSTENQTFCIPVNEALIMMLLGNNDNLMAYTFQHPVDGVFYVENATGTFYVDNATGIFSVVFLPQRTVVDFTVTTIAEHMRNSLVIL